jgi:hypothetical protein
VTYLRVVFQSGINSHFCPMRLWLGARLSSYASATGVRRSSLSPSNVAGGFMQFDLSAVETATLVFIGTLGFAVLLAAFVLTAGLIALVLLGAGKLTWMVVVNTLMAVVHGINSGWDKLVHRASAVELPGDFQGQTSPSTGTYPRVILRDS